MNRKYYIALVLVLGATAPASAFFNIIKKVFNKGLSSEGLLGKSVEKLLKKGQIILEHPNIPETQSIGTLKVLEQNTRPLRMHAFSMLSGKNKDSTSISPKSNPPIELQKYSYLPLLMISGTGSNFGID